MRSYPRQKSLSLYPHQKQLVQSIYGQIKAGKNRIVAKAATGFGKTETSIQIIKHALSRDLPVIFTAPTLTLIDQTLERFTSYGLDCGVIQADHYLTDYSRPVQIASIQTIASQMKNGNRAHMESYISERLVIADEAHIHYKAHDFMMEATNHPFIGFTATPWAVGMGQRYDAIVHGNDIRWLIDNKYLSDYRAYSHNVPDFKDVPVGVNGDYAAKEAGEKYEPKIIGDIVSTWRKHAEGLQTILFAPRVVDADRFAAEFQQAGYNAVAVSGYMDQDDCRAEVERFRRHEVTILCSVSKLAIGFDVSDVGCLIDAQPTKSLMRHAQKIGRGLRSHEGKAEVIILDSAGNLLRNGLPDGDFPMELDDGSEKKDRKAPDDPLPRPCAKCGYVMQPKCSVCPQCLFEHRKQSQVEVESGELIELDKERRKRNREYTWEEKKEYMAGFKWYAKHKGWKGGWAAHAYKSLTGVWPNDKRVKGVLPEPPNEDTQRFITHMNIRRARR